MLRLLLPLAALVAASAAAQSPVVGDWTGEIEGAGLTVTFHVAEADGGLSSTFDVPAQGALGVPTGETTFRGDTLTITVPLVGGRYQGTLVGRAVAGTWSQGGASLPLTLTRAEGGAAAPPERSDTPRPPFPYRDEDVSVASVDGVTLAGTLTVPDGPGPFPGVVLVSGSGPQDRDADVMGHRLFLVLADHLARRGIAVLRYDERGVGASTGDFGAATTSDFALDAQAAAEHLAGRPEVSSVGVVGHSEGGLVAPLVANAPDAVDFVVLLAGPAVPGRDILRYQLSRGLGGAGVSDAGRAAYGAALDRLLDEVSTGSPADAAERAADAFRDETAGLGPADREALGLDAAPAVPLAAGLAGPWERYFIAYDPVPALRALRVPALAVFGGLDRQVRADDNVPAMRAALADAPAGSDVVVFEGLNHLFQPTETGDPAEYGRIDSSYAPAVMEAVADWITARAP
ncbi:alpha/beta hydrolase [Rubrivirga sp. S365]|uniref:alpha/beta hydrolase family protein n=1 Tax=Rubrivirga sp. S365 TaxID=3076080 RepID=UPI0028C68AFE|nr:alpha/beta hydrolase [Rubrivirga sp. S365]MDT7857309.1 alpha/beta hydrolase [Rubrivirga sp. S365]